MYLGPLKVKSFAVTGALAKYLRLKIDSLLTTNTQISPQALIGAPPELKIATKVNSRSALELNLKP
jgi:hypothetical protein